MQKQWSAETLKLRAEAGEAIDKLARSMSKDRDDWGDRNDWTDEERETALVKAHQTTAWVAMVQMQSFDDLEHSVEVHISSGATHATNRGLAEHLAEIY
ncbi:hypothetical protein SEA_COLUCCI_112 [Arthrobacter phage Colucci]|uniref:Uncharacterized protein n=1 Tax=Arthrobacter phage Colucci TaxID=2015834 RepID=A0A286N324_9CAUD|nr:hypothetical protein FDI27_gp112 [Arthrobacter phage Colucci]ASX98781.1 hypothetical protein SEA_COLUCCI_112 [Arthrobacter phage Colucci]